QLRLLDHGRRFDVDRESGIVDEPPPAQPHADYSVLVPRVDADGNELGGQRPVGVEAPIGTFTRWNPRRAGFAADQECCRPGRGGGSVRYRRPMKRARVIAISSVVACQRSLDGPKGNPGVDAAPSSDPSSVASRDAPAGPDSMPGDGNPTGACGATVCEDFE